MESLKSVGQVSGLDQYVFVVRRRVGQYTIVTPPFLADYGSLDKKTKVTTCYVDVKSEPLRDILRDVLKGVGEISLNESKLCVSYAPSSIESSHSFDIRLSRTFFTPPSLSSSCIKAGMRLHLSISREQSISGCLWII